MEYRLLGPLEVVQDGAALELGPPKQRAVLAALLLHRGRVVSTDRLAAVVWGDAPPPSALASVQAYVSNLRRVLRVAGAPDVLVRQSPGYVLKVEATSVDLARFLHGADAARAAAEAGDWTAASAGSQAALELWRGPLLAELADEEWVAVEARALEERRRESAEVGVRALLARGRVGQALGATTQLLAAQPLQESGHWLHLVALVRSGRSAQALEDYRAHARLVDEELGLEPGRELRDLQSAILRGEEWLTTWPLEPGTAASAPSAPTPRAAPAATPSATPAHVPAPRADEGLVGRESESALIDSLVADVRSGRPRWLVLTGPPGIGKTRLASVAARALAAGGAPGREAWARCPDEQGVPAWWPMRQVALGLGVDPGVLAPPPDTDADAARFAVYEQVVALLTRAGAAGPLAVVVDDAQWADASTRSLLAYLAGALRDVPVLFVLTLRDQDDGAAGDPRTTTALLAALARHEGVHVLAVPPLEAAGVAQLVGQVAGQGLGDAEVRVLFERTGGNPLFVTEYARLPPGERQGAIPIAVRSVLGRRLGRLDPAVRDVLATAAVAGETLDLDLLQQTTGLGRDALADRLDDAGSEQIITDLPGGAGYRFTHGLLREQLLAELPPLRRQRLHGLLAAALAEDRGGDALARRAAHLVSAMPLAATREVLDACAAAARDAEQRWDSDSAATWWGQVVDVLDRSPGAGAGDQADERDDASLRRVAALARAGRGQTVLDAVDADVVRAAAAGRSDTVGRLAAVLLRCSGSWPWTSYGEDSAVLSARLADLSGPGSDDGPTTGSDDGPTTGSDDGPTTGAVAGGLDPTALVQVLSARAVGAYYHPDAGVPRALSRRALALAEQVRARTGDDAVLADALVGRVLTIAGVAEAAAESTALLESLVQLHHPLAPLDEVLAHSLQTMVRLTLADADGAAEHVRAGVVGCDRLRLPLARVQLRWAESMIAQWRGQFETAEAMLHRTAQLHQQTELFEGGSADLARVSLAWDRGQMDPQDPVLATIPLRTMWTAAASAQSGQADLALDLLEDLVPVRPPASWYTLCYEALLAHAVADIGAAHLAPVLLERLAPFAGMVATVGQVGVVGTVDLARGRLSALVGDVGRAREQLEASARTAAAAGGTPSVLRSRIALAALAEPGAARDGELARLAAQAERAGMLAEAARAREAVRAQGASARGARASA